MHTHMPGTCKHNKHDHNLCCDLLGCTVNSDQVLNARLGLHDRGNFLSVQVQLSTCLQVRMLQVNSVSLSKSESSQ
jgi:hypothetical protein